MQFDTTICLSRNMDDPKHRPPGYKTKLLKENWAAANDAVSRRIRAVRMERGLSQVDVANLLEIDRSNYHRMERRGEKLTIEQLDRIAKILDVPTVVLIAGQWDGEAINFSNELGLLQKKVTELEEKLRDKQIVVDSSQTQMLFYQRGILLLQREVYIKIWSIGVALGLVKELETKEDFMSTDPFTAHEGTNEAGEQVLIYGNKHAQLTAADLNLIYDYIEQQGSLNYELFINVTIELCFLPDSFLYRTIVNRLMTKQKQYLGT